MKLGDGTGRLWLGAHHLAIDAVSWRVLLEDLQTAYQQAVEGETPRLPAKTTSFKAWAQGLEQRAKGAEAELGYWEKIGSSSAAALPVEGEGPNLASESQDEVAWLDEATTQKLLKQAGRAYRTQIEDLLLTGLVEAMVPWRGSDALLVAMEGHGREDGLEGSDITRTVGWFTSVYPVELDPGHGGWGEKLKRVKEQLREVPGKGVGYGLLRYLGSPEARATLARGPEPKVAFNYLGQLDNALNGTGFLKKGAEESAGLAQSPRHRRDHLITLTCSVSGGRLQMRWGYSSKLHRSQTIQSLATRLANALEALVAHCLTPGVSGRTPSDFPLARLTPSALDTLLTGRRVEDLYPLTGLQEGMLFHALAAEEGSEVYITQLSARLAGPVDRLRMKAAWEELLSRHPILRTSFAWRDLPRALQIVEEKGALLWEEVDLGGLPSFEQQERIRTLRSEQSKRGFDLTKAPLWRLALVRLGNTDHELIWTVHHLLLDGWSTATVLRELFALYLSPTTALPSARPFRDYVEVLERAGSAEAEAFWKSELAGLAASTPLPTAVTGQPTGKKLELSVSLGERLTHGLEALARSHRLTMGTVFQAAYGLLLARHAGEREATFGLTVSGRPAQLKGVEQMVGLFINTVPVRVQTSPAMTVEAWLGALQRSQLERQAHDTTPLMQIQRWSEVPNGRPLFETFLVLENYPVDEALKRAASTEGELTVTSVVSTERDNYPLTWTVLPGRETALTVAFDTGLFDEDQVQRLIRQYVLLLEQWVRDPSQPVGQLSLLDEGEQERMVVAWNATRKEFPPEATVHGLFEAQVARTPAALAVSFQGRDTPYAELDARANQLARFLRRQGVGPESRVALCVERSVEALVGILGILKAGGAYLPMDPALPQERLRFLLEDSGAPLVLTQERFLQKLDGSIPVLCLDRDRGQFEGEAKTSLSTLALPLNTACLIYTSGTTGRPKGTLVPHRGLANLLCAESELYRLGPSSRALHFLSLSFDLSVEEIFLPLWSGATLVIAPAGEIYPGETLHRFLREQKITFVNITPAALNATSSEDLPSLETVVSGGEAITLETARRWAQGRRMFNGYGPTETTVTATLAALSSDQTGTPPIGKPLANVRAFVLDAALRPVPVGARGELFLSGVGITRGYHRRPELTAERFVPDPFSPEPGGRMYRTGDGVRWLPDGALEFLGRNDQQVKVRGFRIELGEIEAALAAVPGVAQNVVEARVSDGRTALVAYVVAVTGSKTDSASLRSALAQELPEYMVPGQYVLLEALPLTPGGKVDRRALPAPEASAEKRSYTAPTTEAERVIAEVWEGVLRTQPVGVTDNFFELGGDSILAIQVVSRAATHGWKLTPRQLFDHPTVRALAQVTRQAEPTAFEQGVVSGDAPLTAIQAWFFELQPRTPERFNQAMLLEVRELAEAPLRAALKALSEHHDVLRARYVQEAGSWRQFFSPSETAPLEVFELAASGDATAQISQKVEQLNGSFSLAQGPVWRACWMRLPDGTGRLWIGAHHLVVDGVSWRVLLEDLESAYRQAQTNQPLRLPAKTTSFQAWAEGVARRAHDEAVRRELPYWEGVGSDTGARLPTDANAENLVQDQKTEVVSLSTEATDALLKGAGQAYRTHAEELLLTALVEGLAQWRGSDRLLLDLEGHGREELVEGADVSRTVGWFTSLYPVELSTGEGGWGEKLKRVKEQLRAVPRKGTGHGLLRYLGTEEDRLRLRNRPRSPLAFNYLGQLDNVLGASSTVFKGVAPESEGQSIAPHERRTHLLSVDCAVVGGRLTITWGYSDKLHSPKTLQALAAGYVASLQALVAHCLTPEAGGRTPSDFPLARLTQTELDGVIAGKTVEDLYPLTGLQEGILFHGLVEGAGSAVYVTQSIARLTGRADEDRLKSGWATLMNRHPILRTSMAWKGLERPLQAVESGLEVPWHVVDLQGLSREEQERRLQELRHQDRMRGFELSKAPLWRVTLVKLSELENEVIWSVHHLLLDGWSTAAVLREYFALYLTPGLTLPALRPFKDYLAWLESRDHARSASYWKETLAGFTEPTQLPFTSSARVSGEKAEYRLLFGEGLSRRLEGMARSQRVTLGTVLQGALGVLLARHAGESEAVFGVAVSGRPVELAGVEEIVGMFLNSVPVRIRIPHSGSVAEWLAHLQRQQGARQGHEHVPLVEVQRWSGVPKGIPLFESLFVLENYPVGEALREGARPEDALTVDKVEGVEHDNFPLTWMVIPGRTEVTLSLSYDTGRFTREQAESLGLQFRALLEQMTQAADQPTSRLTIVDEVERRQLLGVWGKGAVEPAPAQTLHGLFEAQARRTPEAPAVLFEGTAQTFAEVDARARRLAGFLRAQGAASETLIGVCLGACAETVATLLGVLKAGSAYVPLEPSQPVERLAVMLEESRPLLVLTKREWAGTVSEAARGRMPVIALEDLPAQTFPEGEPPRVTAQSAAYVVFTSGSTGKPKGVVGLHGATINRLRWSERTWPFQGGEVCCQKTSLGFVDAVAEIWAPLLAGVPLAVLSRDARTDTLQMVEELEKQKVTRLVLVPSLLRAILEVDGIARRLSALRHWVVSGEELDAGLAQLFAEQLPSARLVNLYGSSEVAGDATGSEVQLAPGRTEVSIGRPLANAVVRILDASLSLVPAGAQGELYVGGAPVARGYVNQPSLTAERFVPDPYGDAGARLYRTGDLARWLPDGRLEFVGRVDHQVKIRGVRIELGEVETALLRHPEISDAVVVLKGTPEDRRLVGYVVRRGASLTPEACAHFLATQLPESMVPAHIVLLESLPLTPTGKVNRKALPDVGELSRRREYEPPQTELENVLANLWEGVLQVEKVGLNDNFFELGGHSLLAMRLNARLAKLGYGLSLRHLLEAPTLREQALRLGTPSSAPKPAASKITSRKKKPKAD
jgi:amino acid adenylation domain-containing protein/non-ribosomal peptide synthase protein (TIGR01720 family)